MMLFRIHELHTIPPNQEARRTTRVPPFLPGVCRSRKRSDVRRGRILQRRRHPSADDGTPC